MRIFTWHVHGSYLYYLAQCRHDFYLPVTDGRPHGYAGRSGPFPWPPNVHEIALEDVRDARFDLVLFQARAHWERDQYEVLSDAQRRLPRVYLEHDPPRQHPTDTRHPVDDPETLLVHVTPFNALMWDAGETPTRVIEHGVMVPPDVHASCELARGLVVINGLHWRGRRLGADVVARVRSRVPLDLVGMESGVLDGLGEVPHDRLPAFMARYRFFFNPIRYTSLGLALCEAMMLGLPIVALATTEVATVVENGVSGWIDTDVSRLLPRMRRLLADRDEALRLGRGARRRARERFGIERFRRHWETTFATVAAAGAAAAAASVDGAARLDGVVAPPAAVAGGRA